MGDEAGMTTTLATTNGAALTGRSLPELEEAVARGFMEMARALKEIRDRQLYKEAGYASFEAYCKGRFDFSRQRAHQIIEAAETTERMSTLVNAPGLPLPTRETHARALAPLKDNPKEQAAAWQEAVETAPNGKVTAEHVAEVVERYVEPEPETEPDEDDSPSVRLAPEDQRFDTDKADLQRSIVLLGHVSQALSAHVDSLDFTVRELRDLRAAIEKVGWWAHKAEALVDAVKERRTQRGGEPMPRRAAVESEYAPGDQQRVLLNALSRLGEGTTRDLVGKTGLELHVASGRLSELRRRGLVVGTGEHRSRGPVREAVYALTALGERWAER